MKIPESSFIINLSTLTEKTNIKTYMRAKKKSRIARRPRMKIIAVRRVSNLTRDSGSSNITFLAGSTFIPEN